MRVWCTNKGSMQNGSARRGTTLTNYSTVFNCSPIFNRDALIVHWCRVMHIYVNIFTIIVSDYGLSPGRHQVIVWTNAGTLLIWPCGKNFSETLIKINISPFKKIHLKLSPAKCLLFCVGLNVCMFNNSQPIKSKLATLYIFNFLIDNVLLLDRSLPLWSSNRHNNQWHPLLMKLTRD